MASDIQQQQQQQLNPRWILVGGCCLAFLSAAVNAGFLIQLGASVSHLTGDATNAAVSLIHRWGQDTILHWMVQNPSQQQDIFFKLLAAIVGFVSGSALAGYFIHHPILEISRPYGRSVSFIGICLIASHFAMEDFAILSVFMTAVACGLQNALATHYRGIILRTTHITGLLTDLGSNLGMKLRGHKIPIWKLSAPFFLVLSFFAGALFGTMLVIVLHLPFLLILALLYLIGGVGWSIYKRTFLHYG